MREPTCGGCPPCCKNCVFDHRGQAHTEEIEVALKDYGCHRDPDSRLVRLEGQLGLLARGLFYGLTDNGLDFLRATKNPIAELVEI